MAFAKYKYGNGEGNFHSKAFRNFSYSYWYTLTFALGYVGPRDVQELYSEFSIGLGINSAQPREAKHQYQGELV